jgi:hypothetical protein
MINLKASTPQSRKYDLAPGSISAALRLDVNIVPQCRYARRLNRGRHDETHMFPRKEYGPDQGFISG